MPDIVSQSAGTRTDGLAEEPEALRKALQAPRHLLVVCALLFAVAVAALVAFVLLSSSAQALKSVALGLAALVLISVALVAWVLIRMTLIRVASIEGLSARELGPRPDAVAGRPPKTRHAAESGALPGIKVGERFFDDPFDIPSGWSGRITPEQHKAIFDIIESKYGHLIEDGFKEPKTRALLLCDREVVGRAKTPEAFDLDRIRQIEQERGHLCYIYGKEDLIEECPWSALGPHDAYPALEVWVGPEEMHESVLRSQGTGVVADFDTGNPRHPDGFYAFDDAIGEQLGLDGGTRSRGRHVGGKYDYIPVSCAARRGR